MKAVQKETELDSKIIEIINKVKDNAQTIFGEKLTDVILFGSYARDDQNAESDLDIMIIVNMDAFDLKKYRDTIVDMEVDISLDYDIVLSIMLQSESEFKKYHNVLPFFISIVNEGISMYG